MSSAAIALRKAVFATLSASSELTARLGGNRIHDHAPANVPFPYLTFGLTSMQDWSTGTEDGNEHIFTVHVWSKAKGLSETLELMEAVRTVLHDASLSLQGHHLVNLRREFEEARFDDDLVVHHGILRFRAVTEPAD
jgi:hypothetical protein